MTDSGPVSAAVHPADEVGLFTRGLLSMGVVCGAITVLAIVAFVFGAPDGGLQKLAVSVGVFGSSAACGAFLGFVFGVPKSGTSRTLEGAPDGEAPGRRRYMENSNLEQISDWLAKIIVGAGLIQVRAIGEGLWSASQTLGVFFDGGTGGVGGAVYSIALIVSGLLVSFNLTYMWARTRFHSLIEAL